MALAVASCWIPLVHVIYLPTFRNADLQTAFDQCLYHRFCLGFPAFRACQEGYQASKQISQ